MFTTNSFKGRTSKKICLLLLAFSFLFHGFHERHVCGKMEFVMKIN